MNVFIFRHCESEGNQNGKLSLDINDKLTAKGLLQAEKLSRWFEEFNDLEIWSSPAKRCLDSVYPFLRKRKTKLTVKNCLNEGQFNITRNLNGISSKWIPISLQHNILEFIHRESDTPAMPVADETVEQFIGRVNQIYSDIQNFKKENLCIITHGHFIREILNIFIGTNFTVRLPVDNGSITHLETEEYLKINYINRLIS